MENEKHAAQSWYALKVFHNRLAAISGLLEQEGVETFVPKMKTTVVDRGGHKVSQEKPLVNSLMFIHTAKEDAERIDSAYAGKAMVYKRLGGMREVAPIPDSEMHVFRLVTDNMVSAVDYLGSDTERYMVGERVRVTDGPLKGSEGHICRIKGNRRLVVSIAGVCAVATSYIPQCFLQKI